MATLQYHLAEDNLDHFRKKQLVKTTKTIAWFGFLQSAPR